MNVPNADVPPQSGMSPMSPGRQGNGFSGAGAAPAPAPVVQVPFVSSPDPGTTGSHPSNLGIDP